MVKFAYGSSHYWNNTEIIVLSRCITSPGAVKHSHPSWIFISPPSFVPFIYIWRSPISICDACHKPALIQWRRYFLQFLCVIPVSNDRLTIYFYARRNPSEHHNSCGRVLQHPAQRNDDVQPYHNTDILKKNPNQTTKTQKQQKNNPNQTLQTL